MKKFYLLLLVSCVALQTFATTYYNKAGVTALGTISNWNTAVDGTGTNASGTFSTGNVYILRNGASGAGGSVTLSNALVIAAGAKLQIGNDTNAITVSMGGFGLTLTTATTTCNVMSSCTLDISGALTVAASSSNFNNATSSVVYYSKATGVQTIGGGTYGSLFLTNTSGIQTAVAGSVITVNGGFTVTSGTLVMGTTQLAGACSPFTFTGTLISTTNTANPALPQGKNWSNGGTATVSYLGTTAAQFVPGGTYNDLTFANTTGAVTVTGNLVVDGKLQTASNTSGVLDLQTFTLGGTLATINLQNQLKVGNLNNPALPTGRAWTGTTVTFAQVTFTSTTGRQYIPTGSYNKLTCQNTSDTNFVLGDLTFNGTATAIFTTSGSGGVLDMGVNAFTAASTITNTGTLVTRNLSAAPIVAGKTYAGTVCFCALTGVQSIPAGTFSGTLVLGNTSGTSTATGNIVPTSLTVTAGGTFDMTSAFKITGMSGTTTIDGTLKSAALTTPFVVSKVWGGVGTVQYNGSGTQNVMAGTYNCVLDVATVGTGSVTTATSAPLQVNNSLIVGGSTILDMLAVQMTSTTTPTVTNSGSITTTHTSASLAALPSGVSWGGSVTFARTNGVQIVPAGTFNNLLMANTTGTVTATGDLTVNGTLTTGFSLNMGTNRLLGTLSAINVGGGILTSCTANPALPTGRDWSGITSGTVASVTFAAASGGQYIPQGTYRTLNCTNTSGTDTVLGNLVINTGTVTATVKTTASGTMNMQTFALSSTGSGILAISNAGTLMTQNTSATPIPTGKTFAGTVIYNADMGGQTIVADTYSILTVSNLNGGTNTSDGHLTIGTLNVMPADTLDMGTTILDGGLASINISGVVKTGVLTTTSANPVPSAKTWNGGGRLIYTSTTGAQTIPGGTFNIDLQFLNTSGTNTVGSAITANDSFILAGASGTIDFSTLGFLGTPMVLLNGTLTTQNTTASVLPSNISWGGTVKFAKAAGGQSIPGGTYNNLTFLNTTGNQTALDHIWVNGALVTNTGTTGTLVMGAFQLAGTPTSITHDGILTTTCTLNPAIPSGDYSGTVGTSKVTFLATTGLQYIPGGTFKSLLCSNTSDTNRAVGNINIVAAGSFSTTATGGKLDMGTNALTGTGTIVHKGTLLTQNSSSTPLPAGKVWNNIASTTVIYNGTGAQTLVSGTFANMTLTGTRTGSPVITLGSGGTDTIVVAGDFTVTPDAFGSIGSYSGGSNTFQYSSLADKTVAPITYRNLYFSNTNNTKTAGGDLTVNGTLTLISSTQGKFSMDTYVLHCNAVSNGGEIQTANLSDTALPSGKDWSSTNGKVTFLSTTGGQYVPAGTYSALSCRNTSGTNYATGNIRQAAIGGAFSMVGAGGTFDMDTYALSSANVGPSSIGIAGGTLITRNTSSAPIPNGKTYTGVVVYTSPGSQTIVGALYRDTLRISGTRIGTPTLTLESGQTITIDKAMVADYVNAVNFVTTLDTVKYTATAGLIPAFTFGSLWFTNATGTNTATGNVVVRDFFSTTGGGTLDMSTFTLSGAMTPLLNLGTLRTACVTNPPIPTGRNWTTGIVQFNSAAGGQSIPTGTYTTLSSLNTSGTNSVVGTVNVTGSFVTSGGTVSMGNNLMTGTSITTSGTGTLTTTNSSATPLISGTTWSQNVTYNRATGGQTVLPGTYNGGLTNSNTSGFNFVQPASTINVAGILTLSAGSVLSDSGNTINLVGNIEGTGTHRGTGKIAMNLDAAGPNSISGATLNNLELNSANGFNLSGDPTINGTLTLTDGVLDLGSNNLLLSLSATAIGGTPGSSKMIMITDVGEVRKFFSATGSFVFPIGDNGPNYTPMTLNVTGGTFAGGAYAGVRVTDAKQPQNANTDNYLTRYWSVSTTGITTPQYDISNATYVPADVIGFASYISSGQYGGSLPWVRYDTVDSVAHTVTTATLTSSTSDISGINSANPTVSLDTPVAICSGDTAVVNATGSGDNTLTYTWSPAADLSASTGNTVMAMPTDPGMHIYTVTITDGNGFTSTATTQVSVNPLPDAGELTGIGSVCYNATMTLANVNPGGVWASADTLIAKVDSFGVVTGMIAITWDTTVDISYTVPVECGSATAHRIVTINALPGVGVFVATNNHQVCIGSSVIYSETHPGGIWSTVDTTIATIDSLTGVLYGVDTGSTVISYTVTSDMGCKRARTGGITVNDLPPVPVIDSSSRLACTGNTINLTGTTGAGSVLWTSMDPTVATVNSSTGVVTGQSVGTAVISYTFTRKCSSSTSTVVTVNATTTASVTGTAVVCASGDMTTLTGTPSGGVWSSSNTSRATVGTTGVVTGGAASGTVTISYVYTNMAGCPSTVNTLVTVNPLPTVASVVGSSTICTDNIYTFTNTTMGGVWSSSNTGVATVGSASGVVTGIAAGTAIISYTVLGGNGCSKSSKLTVTVNTSPAVSPIDAGTGIVCPNATLSLTDTTVYGGTFTWTSSSPSIATVSSGTGIVTGVSAGSATISYNFTSGGCTGRATTLISVNPVVIPTVTPTTLTICPNSTATVTPTPTGGTWTSSVVSKATVGSLSGVVTGVAAGTSVVSYGYTNGLGCVGYATTAVSVNAAPTVAAIAGASSLCANASTLLTDATTGGVWASSNDGIATVGTTGLVSGVSAGAVTISYTFTGGNGCSKTNTKSLTVTAVPTVAAISAGGGIVCQTYTLTLTNATSGTHTWTSANTSVATVNSSTGVVTGVAAGTVVISYNYTSGCTATTTTEVTVNPTTVPTVTGTATVCANGGTTMLTGSPSGGVWSSSAVSKATVGTTGLVTGGTSTGTVTISYSYTNGSGCVGLKNTTVTVNAVPTVNSIAGATSVCVGATAAMVNGTAGGTWLSTNTGAATIGTSGTVTGIAPGTTTISYTVTGVNGCQAASTKGLTVNPTTTVAAITGPTTVVVSSTIALSDVTPGGVWSSSAAGTATVGTSGVVTGVAPGAVTISYTVTGCGTARATYAVSVTASRPSEMITLPDASVSVYPNPTSGTFTINTNSTGIFAVYSLEGKEVTRFNVTSGISEYSLPGGLAAGVYTCKFAGEDGSSAIVRLVYKP